MKPEMITAADAPAVTGCYAQAVRANGFVFTSGQLGIDPTTGEMLAGIKAQTGRALQNTENVLKAVGLDRNQIVKVKMYVANLDDFDKVEAVYREFFRDYLPARCSVEAAKLYRGSLIEIEVIAAE